MFDREDGLPARWPTIGIRLSSLETPAQEEAPRPVKGPVELGAALVETAIEGCQAEHVMDPCNVARTVAVDTSPVGATDFDIDDAARERLIAAGRSTARAFLAGWDYQAWLASCRPATGAGPVGRPQSGGRSSSV
jgi:NTE family protein